MAQEQTVAAQVEAVFSAVERGDAGDTDALIALGDAAVAPVAAYLSAKDDSVRTEAVALLDALDTRASAVALLPALGDSSADIRERAARAVFSMVIADGPPDGLGDAAAKGIAAGDPGAAMLLLGAFAGDEARAALGPVAKSSHKVKLADAALPVSASLAAQVALARKGDAVARAAIEASVNRGDIADLLFLLDVLPLVDDASLVAAIADKTLSDERAAGGGLPSGIEPRRRVADRAVEAVVAKLKLKPGFALDETRRYEPAEIEKVRALSASSLPR